jgi:hypothetical protein
MVDDQRIGDDGIGRPLRVGQLRLPHAVADHFAATEFHFLAVQGKILFHLDDQLGIGQAQAVAGGGAEHVDIGAPRHMGHQAAPITRPRKP